MDFIYMYNYIKCTYICTISNNYTISNNLNFIKINVLDDLILRFILQCILFKMIITKTDTFFSTN